MSKQTERLDAIQKRAADCLTYNFGLRNADILAHSDVPYLLDLARKATALIADLTDPEECSFDHHGGCQAHGYLSLQPGETCPQHDAKEWAK